MSGHYMTQPRDYGNGSVVWQPGVSAQYCYMWCGGSHSSTDTLPTPAGHNMGTKLSKANNSTVLPLEEKCQTLPSQANDEDLTTKSQVLPRFGFDHSSGLGKSFRKSMRKLVGKKKVREEVAEKEEFARVEEKTEAVEEKVGEQEENFKAAQQKARAEFFKEMYTDKEEKGKEEEITASTETEAKEEDEEDEAVNVSLIGTPVEESQQEVSPGEESKEPAERDTATNENLAKQSEQASSDQTEKSLIDEMKKPDDDANNGDLNKAENFEGKGVVDKEVNEVEESEIATVTQEDVTEVTGNDEEIKTAQEEAKHVDCDTEKRNEDEENDEKKSCENYDENVTGSGSESLESKCDDINSEEDSEEGITTDEGIVESEDDNTGLEEDIDTVKSKQKGFIDGSLEAAVTTLD